MFTVEFYSREYDFIEKVEHVNGLYQHTSDSGLLWYCCQFDNDARNNRYLQMNYFAVFSVYTEDTSGPKA